MRLYLNNYDSWSTFTTSVTKAMLVYGAAYNSSHRYVSDVSQLEITDDSYNRVTITNPRKIVDPTAETISYTCNDIAFGIIDNETVNGLILYQEVTSDLDSKLLGYWSFADTALSGLTVFELEIPPAGLVVISNAIT